MTPRAQRRQDGLLRITAPISAAVLAVAAASLVPNAGRVSAAAFAGSVAALAVATVAIGFVFSPWCRDDRAALLAFLAAGAAGSVLAALLPASPAFVIAFLALAGLGMSELPIWPFAAAAVVFAAMSSATPRSSAACWTRWPAASGWPWQASRPRLAQPRLAQSQPAPEPPPRTRTPVS